MLLREWKGTKYWDGTTFLVDPTGVVRKVYEKVDPKAHEQAVPDKPQKRLSPTASRAPS